MKRVLIVEDDTDIATAVGIGLQAKGHEVVVAGTGRRMNEVLSESEIDVILLDLGLPDVDGMELIAQVRRWSEVPIVVVSARHDSHGKIAALDAGADDYVTKPFSLGEVLARLRAIERRTGKTGETGLVRTADGRVVIDLAAHLLEVEGEPVHLTPIEWKMLEVFVKHKGALVEAQTLLTEVWGRSSARNGTTCASTCRSCGPNSKPTPPARSTFIRRWASGTASRRRCRSA